MLNTTVVFQPGLKRANSDITKLSHACLNYLINSEMPSTWIDLIGYCANETNACRNFILSKLRAQL